MLAIFCARVALGLIGCLLLFSPQQLHPRFFRTQFLTALGLCVIATLAEWSDAVVILRVLFVVATVLALFGAIGWSLEPAPAGRIVIFSTTIAMIAVLTFLEPSLRPSPSAGEGGLQNLTRWRSGSDGAMDWSLPAAGVTSAMFLGSALTAMLVGHSYLISPGMALTPLLRTFFAGAVAFLVRIAVIAWGLWRWTEIVPTYNLNNEVVLWLPVRWLVGVVAPIGFGLMAYLAARIRSTQSATGILYVVVVCEFLGELLSLLLTRQTGIPL
jgi:hypothetical protein